MKINVKEKGTFILGIAICFAVAGISVLIEKLIPGELLGGDRTQHKPCRLQEGGTQTYVLRSHH